ICGKIVDLTLTNSEPGRRALVTADHLRPERVAVLENGVDVERFAGFPPPDARRQPVRVGAVANLRPVKGLDLLIRAAGKLLHAQFQFEIAGEGDQRPELERLITELHLGNRVRLVGAVADVPKFLASLDIAVLCSRSEGMSNALLEYMAAGRAIIATRVGANEQLVRDGEDGLLIPPGDDERLAGALAQLLADPALAARLGASARRRAVESFSREAMRRRFQEFYRKLGASGRHLKFA
ncbi:MAG: glycosyltransferase, partial [Gemmataceae bacterium]